MVAGGDAVGADGQGLAQEAAELEVAVAAHAGVRGATGGVLAHERINDALAEVGDEVHHIVGDTEGVADASCTLHAVERAAGPVSI